MNQKDFDAYLAQLDIPVEQKRYASSFLKKNTYLNQIQQMGIMNNNLSNNSPEILEMGFGNFNTNIMFVIASPGDKKTVLKFLTPLLERINISIWNCYLTFLVKVTDKAICYEILEREKQCINPEVIVTFNYGTTNFDDIKNIIISMDDIKYVLDENNFKTERYMDIMKGVYSFLPRLILFKELESAH